QPWTDGDPGAAIESPVGAGAVASDPVRRYLGELQSALGDLLTTGLERANSQTARHWQDLGEVGERFGFARLARPVRELFQELERRPSQLDWSAQRACEHALALLAYVRFGIDLI